MPGPEELAPLDRTVHEVRQQTAWLFLVDVIDSTGISRRLVQQDGPGSVSDWLTLCRDRLEGSGAIIDKPLGDGLLALWPIVRPRPSKWPAPS